MVNKNKKTLLQKKNDTKLNLVKIAREAKMQRLWRLSGNM